MFPERMAPMASRPLAELTATARDRSRTVRTSAATTRRTTESLLVAARGAIVWTRVTAAARGRLRTIAGGAADDGAGPSPRTPVVLVVDDHADTREMYTTFLVAMGLATVEATTCAEALACVGTAVVDVLVLDRRLPDGDGDDVVRALRADPRTRPVPIVILSGHPQDGMIGADAYLLKPVVPDALYQEIKRLLAARGPSSS